MKSVLTIALFLTTMQAHAAPTKLVEYTFGNPQEGSSLQIFSDGTIVHGERICCPSRTDQVPESNLTSTQLAQLVSDIAAASKGKLKARNGDAKSTPKTGSLYVYKNSRQVIVLEVEPSAGSVTITTNQTTEATNILRMVTAFTKVDP